MKAVNPFASLPFDPVNHARAVGRLQPILDENARLPRLFPLISPIYLPPNSPDLKVWGDWCRSHPRSEWPEWLKSAVMLMSRGKRKVVTVTEPTPAS